MNSIQSFRCLTKLNQKFSVLQRVALDSKVRLHSTSVINHQTYIKDIAQANPPKGLSTLIELLKINGEEIVDPSKRNGLIPFLIPVSRSPVDNSLLCYIRWPTQKDDMDLQLVRTNEVGVKLVATNTDQFCQRLAIELDFNGMPNADKAVDLINKDGEVYKIGAYLPFLKSGKFPTITKEDLKLVLDRYLLTKVGPFPDCYERLASNFVVNNNDVSALVTCERSVSVFYGWGHPLGYHAQVLAKLPGREKEAKETARSSMSMPAWTIASTKKELDELMVMAGFTGSQIVGEMHMFRSTDPRTNDIGEGLSPIQVTLDQAAHLMDAVALGVVEGGWDAVKSTLAEKYRNGGYPEISAFIEAP
eukprot:gene6127-8446_t